MSLVYWAFIYCYLKLWTTKFAYKPCLWIGILFKRFNLHFLVILFRSNQQNNTSSTNCSRGGWYNLFGPHIQEIALLSIPTIRQISVKGLIYYVLFRNKCILIMVSVPFVRICIEPIHPVSLQILQHPF